MIKKLRVTVDGKPYEVTVEMSEESETSVVPASIPQKLLAAASSVATVSSPLPFPGSVAPATSDVSGPGEVLSPLSGRVIAVAVNLGQKVTEGGQLLTLEAMKMNTFVFAPKSGNVTAVHVAVGDVVNERQPLLKIE